MVPPDLSGVAVYEVSGQAPSDSFVDLAKAAQTVHAAGFVPSCRCFPVRFLGMLLPPRGAMAAAECGPGLVVGWRIARSRRDARTTVYPWGTGGGSQHLLPYAPQAPGTPQPEPTPRTNGALPTAPGGTTAALTDPALATPTHAVTRLALCHQACGRSSSIDTPMSLLLAPAARAAAPSNQ